MSERYYLNLPLTPGPVELDGPEARHLATVSRFRRGDDLCLFNGDGLEYPARVLDVARRTVMVEILGCTATQRELPFQLEVAAPIPKGDRSQFLIEKLTELGVTTFIPLACQRSIIHPREARREKFERYVIEASKQCGRNVLMKIGDLTDWASWCQEETLAVRLLAHPSGPGFGSALPKATALRCAVGPEGGFTDAEVEMARAVGWRLVSLGTRILRIETAALVLAGLASALSD